jgi:hypothetical protein
MAALSPGNVVPVYFNIGRMNPPTFGHMRLIQSMVDGASSDDVDKVYVILSSNTRYASKDPLECEFKKTVVEAMIQQFIDPKGVVIEVICIPDGNSYVYSGLIDLVKRPEFNEKQINFVMFAGDDRSEMADEIPKSLAPVFANPPQMVSLPREGMVTTFEVDKKLPSPEQMSSSYVKDFIMKTKDLPLRRRLSIFEKIYAPLDRGLIEGLFQRLDARLAFNQKEMDATRKKQEDKEKRDRKKEEKQKQSGAEKTSRPRESPYKKGDMYKRKTKRKRKKTRKLR